MLPNVGSMATKSRQRGTLVLMGPIMRAVVSTAFEAIPRGKVLRLQVRMTLEEIVTFGLAAFAVASSVGFQVARWWVGRSGRP